MSIAETTSSLATDFVRPFIEATHSVITSMLASQCEVGEAQPVKNGHRMFEVTSVIGLTGSVTGALSFSIPAVGARKIFERMTGIESDTVDEMVRDAIGEMANMIAGCGKKQLESLELLLGLPQVIMGSEYVVFSPRWSRHLWFPIRTDFSDCTVDIGFDFHALENHKLPAR